MARANVLSFKFQVLKRILLLLAATSCFWWITCSYTIKIHSSCHYNYPHKSPQSTLYTPAMAPGTITYHSELVQVNYMISILYAFFFKQCTSMGTVAAFLIITDNMQLGLLLYIYILHITSRPNESSSPELKTSSFKCSWYRDAWKVANSYI